MSLSSSKVLWCVGMLLFFGGNVAELFSLIIRNIVLIRLLCVVNLALRLFEIKFIKLSAVFLF